MFDVDGTLAETERDGHRPAFNSAFARHGLDVEWDPVEYGALLGVTGGRHRVAHYLRAHGHGPDADELAARVRRTKACYRKALLGQDSLLTDPAWHSSASP